MKMKYSNEIKREMKGLPRKRHPFKLSQNAKSNLETLCVLTFWVFGFIAAIFYYIGLF